MKNLSFEQINYLVEYYAKYFPKNYEIQVKLRYFLMSGKRLNLKNPQTYIEKINYLRLNQYANNHQITKYVDKYNVKKYLSEIGYSDKCAKLYGAYKQVDEINWEELPESFVIKCNHGSGYNIVCKYKKKLNLEKVKHQLQTWMNEDYWKKFVELQYKNIQKKIIIEEYLGDDIETYRFCCFNGEPKFVYVSSRIKGKDYNDFYSLNWRKLKVNEKYSTNIVHAKPQLLDEMILMAKTLSGEFPFVRVDLYEKENNIFFSEFTFLPAGGYFVPSPERFNIKWGRWIKIK